jgi:hypothetical protein
MAIPKQPGEPSPPYLFEGAKVSDGKKGGGMSCAARQPTNLSARIDRLLRQMTGGGDNDSDSDPPTGQPISQAARNARLLRQMTGGGDNDSDTDPPTSQPTNLSARIDRLLRQMTGGGDNDSDTDSGTAKSQPSSEDRDEEQHRQKQTRKRGSRTPDMDCADSSCSFRACVQHRQNPTRKRGSSSDKEQHRQVLAKMQAPEIFPNMQARYFERRTPDMHCFVSHTDVPIHRTCIQDCNTLSKLVIAKDNMCEKWFGKKGMKCFTCCAYWESKHKPKFDAEKSIVIKFWVEFKTRLEYSKLSHHDKLSALAVFLAVQPNERKSLSYHGATRLSRSEALRVLASKAPCCNYYTLMACNPDDSGTKHLGYIMYQDVGNQAYATWLNSVCKVKVVSPEDPANVVNQLNIEHKGDVVEAILGLGFIWQLSRKAGLDNTDLDGIMELVTTIENELQTMQFNTQRASQLNTHEKEDEESTSPVNSDDCSEAWGCWKP